MIPDWGSRISSPSSITVGVDSVKDRPTAGISAALARIVATFVRWIAAVLRKIRRSLPLVAAVFRKNAAEIRGIGPANVKGIVNHSRFPTAQKAHPALKRTPRPKRRRPAPIGACPRIFRFALAARRAPEHSPQG
jgi:hypothetical protein